LLAGLLLALLAACGSQTGSRGPLVLAASSLQEALTAAADDWEAQGHPRPVLSFAASSALARQVESGAPADIFISADEDWMDAIEREGLLRPGSRADLLGNALVLIAPAVSTAQVDPSDPAALSLALGDGRLAMADPDAVPAGRYGKSALEGLGAWYIVEHRVARAENVRAALALVERGEAPLGVVYATDAEASRKVRVVARFPDASHPPIRYPVALLSGSANPGAEAFRAYLASARAQAIFARYGFTSPKIGPR
jgi:molybdate transport system substrate-binding protein